MRNKFIEGVVLDQKNSMSKIGRTIGAPVTYICGRAKMRQISFPAFRDFLEGLSPSADVLIIMQNIPSREGYNTLPSSWTMRRRCVVCSR